MSIGISEQTIEEIKARTDLADLIAGYGIQVKRAGGSYKACCPFHHEKTPSFNINADRGFYHCFGCGESGDAIKFVMRYEGLTFVEAARKLAAAANVALEEKEDPLAGVRKRLFALHAELAAFYGRCLRTAKEAEAARAYLTSRGISQEIAERFQIGYAPKNAEAMLTWAGKHGFTEEELLSASIIRPMRYAGDSRYSPFSGRLMFSIRDRSGRVIAFSGRTLETDKTKMRGGKYVNSYDSPIFKKSDVLYALDLAATKITAAKPIREAIVCEGQIDVIRCHAFGFDRAVASQGTAFTKEHVQILKKVADAAVLVFDGDGAGRKAAVRTGGEMLEAGVSVRVARLPIGEDPDSLLLTKGAEAFQACLDSAESLVSFMIRCALETEQNPESYDAVARAANGVLNIVKTVPSAVMRASLLRETSTLLKIPVEALEADLAKIKEALERRRPPAHETAQDASSTQEAQQDAERRQTAADEPLTAAKSEDASAAENNPPPGLEMSLMEFLYWTEHDGQIVELLEAYAPPELFAHDVTRAFVDSYVREVRGESGAIERLVKEVPEGVRKFLETVFCSVGRANASQLLPLENFRRMLKSLWSKAMKRRHDEIAASDNVGHERLRVKLSMAAKSILFARWDSAVKLMDPEMLKSPGNGAD